VSYQTRFHHTAVDLTTPVKSGTMARYLQVSRKIASDIASGALAAGDELLSIRDAADRY
jgi:DNA-binding transcriptional regulator YhcF (GntR family)